MARVVGLRNAAVSGSSKDAESSCVALCWGGRVPAAGRGWTEGARLCHKIPADSFLLSYQSSLRGARECRGRGGACTLRQGSRSRVPRTAQLQADVKSSEAVESLDSSNGQHLPDCHRYTSHSRRCCRRQVLTAPKFSSLPCHATIMSSLSLPAPSLSKCPLK